MPATATLQQLSDDIISVASDIIKMSQRMRDKELAEFLHATPDKRAVIVNALNLTPEQVNELFVAEREVAALTPVSAPGAQQVKPRQLWDYDTKTATVEDLTRRRDLLRTRLRIMQYLRSL